MTNRHLFNEVKCRDPLEPDYRGGSITGMIYAPGHRLVSHAHGLKKIYELADAREEQIGASLARVAEAKGPIPDVVDEYSTAALLKVHLQRSPPLVENLIAPHLTYLVGDPKAGKSFLAMQIANAISKGETIFGCEVPEKRRALYFAVENGYEETVDRIQNMGLDGDVVWRFKGKNFEQEPDSVEELLVMLTDEVTKDASIGVIFLDTLRFMAGPPPKVDGGNAQDRDYAQLKPIQSWCQKAGVGVVALAHTNKAQDGRGGLRTQIASTAGSNLIMGTAESILTLSRHVDKDTMANLAHGLIQRTGRSFKDDTALEVTFEGSNTSFVMTSEHEKAALKVMQKARTNSCRQAIAKELLNESEGVERKELREKVMGRLGVARQTFNEAVRSMIDEKALKERDGRLFL